MPFGVGIRTLAGAKSRLWADSIYAKTILPSPLTLTCPYFPSPTIRCFKTKTTDWEGANIGVLGGSIVGRLTCHIGGIGQGDLPILRGLGLGALSNIGRSKRTDWREPPQYGQVI